MVVVVAADGVVHQLVDDDVPYPDRAVVGPRRAGRQGIQLGRPVGPAPEGDAVGLALELDGVQDAAAVGVDQEERAAGGAGNEAQLRLVEGEEAAGRDEGAWGDDELIGGKVVGENAAGQVVGLVAVVVEFDEAGQAGVFGVGQHFVDENVAQGAGPVGLALAGGAADDVADVPGLRLRFAVGGVGQDYRVAGAIGRHRPGRNIGVGDAQQDRSLVVQQLKSAGALETAGVRADDVGDAIDGLDARGRSGDDQKGPATQDGPGREGVRQVIGGHLVAAEVLEPGIGIVELEELEVVHVGARGGVVHDFRDDQWGSSAARPQRFVGIGRGRPPRPWWRSPGRGTGPGSAGWHYGC